MCNYVYLRVSVCNDRVLTCIYVYMHASTRACARRYYAYLCGHAHNYAQLGVSACIYAYLRVSLCVSTRTYTHLRVSMRSHA